MRIGLFGGTFDPFHLGHLGAAIHLREMCDLDEVWIMPTVQSPLKSHQPVDADHRRSMIERSIEDVEGLSINLTDLERPGPTYTIDTLSILREQHPDVEFSLCMSDDVAQSLPQWRSFEEIIEQVPLIVSRRLLSEIPSTGNAAVDEAIQRGYVETPITQIEATVIRERLGLRLTCIHLVPAPVHAYIQKHQLYGRISSLGDE